MKARFKNWLLRKLDAVEKSECEKFMLDYIKGDRGLLVEVAASGVDINGDAFIGVSYTTLYNCRINGKVKVAPWVKGVSIQNVIFTGDGK